MEQKCNIRKAAVLTADCYSKHVNTLTPTLFQSKSSNFGGATSLASESNAELAISAKKIISIMLTPIPVIHETHWYVNSICHFFPFAQWTLWRTAMIHRLFFHSFYWIKTGRNQQGFSGLYTLYFILYASRCPIFDVLSSGWTNLRKKMHRHYWGADKSLARPRKKQSTATENFDFHITYLYSYMEEYYYYIYNKTSNKWNILNIKQNTSRSKSN